MSSAQLKQALNFVKESEFQIGQSLHHAHEICQSYEGQMEFDWIHALIHRIEGDEYNAKYWYERAGRKYSDCDFDIEWEKMFAELTISGNPS